MANCVTQDCALVHMDMSLNMIGNNVILCDTSIFWICDIYFLPYVVDTKWSADAVYCCIPCERCY